jgi:AraC-like DNA-binding protein
VIAAQPRDDVFDRWREEFSSAFMPVDVVPNFRDGSRPRVSALTTGALGSLKIFEITGSAVDIHRTRATIRRHDPGLVKVVVLLRGRGLVAQRERHAVLAPGDFVVYDTSEPYRLRLENDYTLFVVMVPREAIKMPANGISSISAVPVRADRGVGALVSPFLSGLRQGLSVGSLNPNPRFEEAAIDLICASVTAHASQKNGTPDATILVSAMSFIDTHHADPALDTSMVAAAHHISPRYLQKLFAAAGITVAGCIKERRLERCRNDLEDRSLLRDSIGTICARHGYIDSAHFSRLFKGRYGLSPRAFREQLQANIAGYR